MNIVVRAPNWVGDCIMCLPAIRALKDNRPTDNIIVATRQKLSAVFQNINDINEFISIPDTIQLRNLFKVAAKLKTYNFKCGILLTNSFNSALMFRLAGVKELTGYSKDLRGFLLDKKCDFPREGDKKHQRFIYQDLISAFIGEKINKEYSDELAIDSDEKQKTARLLTSEFGVDLSTPLIGISPAAAYGSAKQWLPERFAELIRRICLKNREYQVMLLGSDREREQVARIIAAAQVNDRPGNRRVFNLAGGLPLRETIAAISLCRTFIGNDSGLMHVASSLRIPMLAIFGPTSPWQTAPLSQHAKVIHHPVECAPCKYRDCPIDHKCMKAVTVAEVYEEVKNKSAIWEL